jgi:hypothetical protein
MQTPNGEWTTLRYEGEGIVRVMTLLDEPTERLVREAGAGGVACYFRVLSYTNIVALPFDLLVLDPSRCSGREWEYLCDWFGAPPSQTTEALDAQQSALMAALFGSPSTLKDHVLLVRPSPHSQPLPEEHIVLTQAPQPLTAAFVRQHMLGVGLNDHPRSG